MGVASVISSTKTSKPQRPKETGEGWSRAPRAGKLHGVNFHTQEETSGMGFVPDSSGAVSELMRGAPGRACVRERGVKGVFLH